MKKEYIIIALTILAAVVWFLVFNKKTEQKAMCKWGRWLPCDADGKQRRYAVSAADGDFECGLEQQTDTRDCANTTTCDNSGIPYCVCRRYDLDGKCVESDTVFGRCEAPNVSPDAYTLGYCDSQMKCAWGPWLACEDGKQARYEISASVQDPDSFVCGDTRRVETRDCPEVLCNRALMPHCACTRYDMRGNCQSRRTVTSACDVASTDQFTPGACETV
jgi:hypothetical protein